MNAPWSDPAHDSGRLDGWGAWSDAVRALLAQAASEPASLLMFDEDYVHWPLGEKACVDALEQWALGGRQLHCTMLATDWQHVPRQHPRWLRWRVTWAHKLSCRALPDDEQSALQSLRPMLVLEGRLGISLLDTEHGTGIWSRAPSTLREWWQGGDAISQRSIDAMPATTLGL
ncbi:MAG TPA: hypothetical protein H9903_03725 [Candidatus Aquabacterium excrementipullorum]|nr:hypothetical protein [Candidatus Aquabacterium excrementipullorum]